MVKVDEQASDCVKYSLGQPLTFQQALALRSCLGLVQTRILQGRTLPITIDVTVPGLGRLSLTIRGIGQAE